jgi:hypothetical protein
VLARPVRAPRNGVRIQVVKRNGADIRNGHELGGEVIMTGRNMVGRPGWQIPDEALDPDHTVHRQGVIGHTLVGCDTRGGRIPPGHRGVVVVIEPRLRKGKRRALARWKSQRKRLDIEEGGLVGCCLNRMQKRIAVVPGHGRVEPDR